MRHLNQGTTMTPEQRFLSEGADYFGNRLIYRNQDVGVLSASGVVLTPDGEKTLAVLEAITDVEPKPVERKRVKIVLRSPEPTEPLAPVLGAALDDMLAEIK